MMMEERLLRIGEFSAQFSLEADTVRYYINKGLLIPSCKNGRYLFSEKDAEDLRHLLRLKKMHFSLSDIHRILSLERLSDLDSPEELEDYICIFRRQLDSVSEEERELQSVQTQLRYEIENASGKHTGGAKKLSGVPLDALPLLACPSCRKKLALSDAEIRDEQILNGTISCACGYQASIREGIIVGEQGAVSRYDGPDLERNCYRRMSPDLVTLMQRDYQWLLERIGELPAGRQVVLEDFVNDYCFLHANMENMDAGHLYIITDKFPEIVKLYKNLIDQKNLPHQVLYIAAASHLLPLRDGCVDLYLDFASNEYAIFNNGYAMEPLKRHFHRNTCALGSFWHFPMGCPSLKELKRQYPETWEHNFHIQHFLNYLRENWRELRACEQLGAIEDSGEAESFSYHQPGDILRLTSYFVSGFRTEGA